MASDSQRMSKGPFTLSTSFNYQEDVLPGAEIIIKRPTEAWMCGPT